MNDKIKNILTNRKFRYGSTASAITAIVIAVVIIINVIMSIVSTKVNTSVDLTKNKVFSLENQSIEFIKRLNKNIEIIVLNSEEQFLAQEGSVDYLEQANSILKQCAKNSSKIKLTYIDPNKNPDYIEKYRGQKISLNSVIIDNGDKYKILSLEDLFEFKNDNPYSYPYINSSQAEQAILSAILYVTSDAQTKISFISGYDEADATSFINLLKKNNYDVATISVLSDDIPQDAAAVVIFGPTKDYDSTGIDKLNKFLDNEGKHGKNIVYVANYESENDMPTLNDFLQQFGIKTGSGIAFETNSSNLIMTRNPAQPTSNYGDPDYTKNLKNTKVPVFTPYSKPIEIIDKENSKILLELSAQSGIIPKNADENWKITEDKITGPITTAAMSKKTYENGQDTKAYIVGSYYALAGQFLSATSLNNSAYFINMFNIMSGHGNENNTISIESKTLGGQDLGLNANQVTTIQVIVIFIIPVIVLIIGSVVWVRRKNR